MDGLSLIHSELFSEQPITDRPEYVAGNAFGWLYRGNKQAATNYPLVGRLYLAKSNWLLLSVPNALVRGVYDALSAPGAELPLAGALNVPNVKEDVLNAHISVMTADEVEKVGPDKINERGHMFSYTLGAMTEITPKNVAGVSKIWAIQITSPALSALRRSYGLPSFLNDDHPFHITVAIRRTGVLHSNEISKCYETPAADDPKQRFRNIPSRGELKAAAVDQLHGGNADHISDQEFSASALAEGAKHEHEHTDNDQIAKEIAKDHLQESPSYYEKLKKIEKSAQPEIVRRATKTAGSVYLNQALNALNTRQPIRYDHNKPVFENIQNQLLEMKRRGDFVMQTRRNHDMYMAALSPQYRHQRMLQAFRGTLPQPHPVDTAIENYGDQLLSQFGRRA